MNGRKWLVGIALAGVLGGVEAQENGSLFPTQQQFLNSLGSQQEQNRRSIGQNDHAILDLENRMAQENAEQTRRQSELFRLNATPPGALADEMQRNDARQRMQMEMDQSRSRQEQMGAELQRHRCDRARLGNDEQELQRLQSEYDANPARARELIRQLNGR